MSQFASLIIFVRHPELGSVKTRLAAGIGNNAALEVYTKLLAHTQKITTDYPGPKMVFYAGEPIINDLWETNNFHKYPQQGSELGERMQHAFEVAFTESNQPCMIIGSDCYELSTAILDQASAQLQQYDLVIGPALDGGYYLLGMRANYPFLFKNINWSTSQVLEQTLAIAQQESLRYFLLPALRDVDDLESLRHFPELYTF